MSHIFRLMAQTRWFFRGGLIGLVTVLAACDMPRDAEDTLERVQGGHLRVGLVENPPWVERIDGEPAGVEVTLVRQLARELNATPDWVWAGEEEHMEALKRFELDLVIGGLTRSNPWKKKVGMTRPYFEDRIEVGVPRGMAPLEDLKGVQVAAELGTATAHYLEKKDAVPVRLEDPSQATGPVAAPDWQLESWGLVSTGIALHKEKHVMAVPPGENAWLARLQEFLRSRRGEVRSLLQRQEVSRR